MYNRSILKLVFIACFILSLGKMVSAQIITEEQVTVVAPYSPTLTKAHKIYSFPLNEENASTKFKLDYYTNPKLISTTFELEELKAARYASPKDPKYKQNIVKAGMGLYTTPYAELFLNGKLNKNLTLGIHAKHLSSKASVDDFAYSGFSKNGVDVWTKKTGSKYALWIAGFYQRDAFHYYGFKPNEFNVIDSVFKALHSSDYDLITAQVFSDAGLGFSINNISNKTKGFLNLDGSYRYFWDRFNNNENLINFNGLYQRPIEFIELENQTVGLELATELAVTTWNEETQPQKPLPDDVILNFPKQFFHGKFDLNVFYKIEYDRFDFRAGGIVSVGFHSAIPIKAYPDFLLNANVAKNILDVYIQFDGGLMSPTYYSLSRDNPFLATFIPLKYTSRTSRFKSGLKATILGKADIHLWGSYENLLDAVFFTTDTNSVYANQFNLMYDDVDLLQIGGDVSIAIGDASIDLQMIYQKYTMTEEEQAWYKPKWSGQLKANYWLWDNLKLSLALKSQSKVWAKVGDELHEIDSWLDLGASANYHLNKELSAFVSLNNLLSQNYQMWYNYPVKGLGAMLGVSYAF